MLIKINVIKLKITFIKNYIDNVINKNEQSNVIYLITVNKLIQITLHKPIYLYMYINWFKI